MKTSTGQPQLPVPKVKNILFRYCPEYQGDRTRYPEDSHLLKHFPKYYKNLSIDITSKGPLLSKIKKIKKLNSFKGYLKGDKVSPTLLFSLFKSHQKEIEEIPKIQANSWSMQQSFRKLTVKGMKIFSNITSLHFNSINFENIASEQWDILSIYISNLRRLKRLKIQVEKKNYERMKGVIGRFDKMKRLMTNLKQLKFYVKDDDMDIQDLFEFGSFMARLTTLEFERGLKKWYPFVGQIPHVCKNLLYLSICFEEFFSEDPEFTEFLVSLKDMPELQGVSLECEKNMKEFLKVWKPQTSLGSLKLLLDFTDMDFSTINFESKDFSQYENLVQHWDDLEQLHTLDVLLVFRNTAMMLFVRILMTMILKKVRKLRLLRCWMCLKNEVECTPFSYMPFILEEIPHLYESLEELKIEFCDCYRLPSNVSSNLGVLKVFKNLKKINTYAEQGIHLTKIKDVVELLEKHKDSELNLVGVAIGSKNDLKKILEEISKAKRRQENNLKIELKFEFHLKLQGEEVKYLKKFYHVIESIKPIKGLLISLNMQNCGNPPREKIRAIIRSYPKLRYSVAIFLDNSVVKLTA